MGGNKEYQQNVLANFFFAIINKSEHAFFYCWGGGSKKNKNQFRPIFSPFRAIWINFDFWQQFFLYFTGVGEGAKILKNHFWLVFSPFHAISKNFYLFGGCNIPPPPIANFLGGLNLPTICCNGLINDYQLEFNQINHHIKALIRQILTIPVGGWVVGGNKNKASSAFLSWS